jgi:hypothetical protein
MHHPSKSSFDHQNIWWQVQIMKLL